MALAKENSVGVLSCSLGGRSSCNSRVSTYSSSLALISNILDSHILASSLAHDLVVYPGRHLWRVREPATCTRQQQLGTANAAFYRCSLALTRLQQHVRQRGSTRTQSQQLLQCRVAWPGSVPMSRADLVGVKKVLSYVREADHQPAISQ